MSEELRIIENDQQNTPMYLITKAEIDMQISTAKAFPRSLKTFLDRALSMATLNEEIAESCTYSLPRAGKTLDGPSVRLAEIVSSTYGNIRAGARVVENDGRMITAQGICHDLESNYCVTVEVKRKITDKNGRTFSEDMQVVTGNAAAAIAFRNAVFKVVPAALVSNIYDNVKQVAKGTAATLTTRRTKAVEWFNQKGIKNEQICDLIKVKKIEDIDLELLAVLSGVRSSVKNGESLLSDHFNKEEEKLLKQKISEAELESAKAEIKAGNTTVENVQNLFDLTEEQLSNLNSIENEKSK
jgi:hypothetical protein